MEIRRRALGEQKEGAVAAGDIGRLDRPDWPTGAFSGGGGIGEASAHAAAPENVLVLSFTHQARVSIAHGKIKIDTSYRRCKGTVFFGHVKASFGLIILFLV